MTILIFVSYSHKDNDHRLRLTTHLAPLLREKDVDIWYDGDIEPGKAITPEIRKKLRETDIFVGLASSSYFASDYCYKKEYLPMLRKAKRGRPKVVVAMVETCDWRNTITAAYKVLPDDGKSVDKHGNRNQAYLEIVQGIRRVVRSARQEKGKARAEADRLSTQKVKAAEAKRLERRKKTAEGASATGKPKAARKVAAPKSTSSASRPVVRGAKRSPIGPKIKPISNAARAGVNRVTKKPKPKDSASRSRS